MDSSANHQWLAELDNEEPGELDFLDPLSMQQLAESLANELWSPPPQEQQQERQDQSPQRTHRTASPTSFLLAGDTSNATKSSLTDVRTGMFSFTDGLSGELSFSGHQPGRGSGAGAVVSEKWCPPPSTTGKRRGGRRPCSNADEHVVAERKRREKMHKQFATLASIIPDITKTDKVSVLDSTLQYVHHLRDRLKALQEEHHHHHHHQSTAESPPLDARCCIGSEEDDAGEPMSPKIEADVRGTTALLRVACREKKGVLIMVLTELEKHGLSVVNTNVVPFADSSLNITITAQIEDGSSTTVEVVKALNSALRNF
ncbi:hypothetical protein ACP70R_019740 [Stipagrostis hirtigluma subsp. patula]